MGISYALNPLVLPPVLIGTILIDAGASGAETARVAGIVALLLTLLPALFLGWMVRSGRAASVEILDRRARLLPYLFGAGCGLLLLLYSATGVFTAASLVFSISLCVLVNTTLMMLVNRRWKISIHAAGMAGFLALLLTIAIVRVGEMPDYTVWIAAALPLVMWARVRSGAHTSEEVFAGAVLGLVLPPIEMLALHGAGIW